MRFFIHLAFDGGRYCGWQIQPNGITLQQELENALSVLLSRKTQVTGCGRTDTGVHARQFYAHFDVPAPLSMSEAQLAHRLNRILPPDIVIHQVIPVTDEAHARFSAISRTYRYYISLQKNPFDKSYRWFRPGRPDMEAMNQAAAHLKGFHDFSSFSKTHTQTATNLCNVSEAYWKEQGSDLIFTITADRFLRNMVRAIVGTLWQTGAGQLSPEAIPELMQEKDRSAAGMSVPACGLFLESVIYPAGILPE